MTVPPNHSSCPAYGLTALHVFTLHFRHFFLTALLVSAILVNPFRVVAQPVLDDDIHFRVMNMECPFTPTYDASVQYIINSYLRNPESLSKLMGKSSMYFQYFERALQEYGLPEQLKYLPIVESGLRAGALSHAAAKGLWQFIPDTGRRYGLFSTGGVEDRSDVIKSSDAAARYLKFLFETLGSWDLALAAYNCGENRVLNVMASTQLSDYQSIKKFLPRETQGYVPAFVAVSYLMQHYHHHDIKPVLPELDLQLTTGVKVYRPLSFFDIQRYTGLSYSTIEQLNPHILTQRVPASKEGTFVYVPRRVASAFISSVNEIGGQNQQSMGDIQIDMPVAAASVASDHYFRSSMVVNEGESLSSVAAAIGASPFTIMAWNNLTSPYIAKRTEIAVFVPRVNDTGSSSLVFETESMIKRTETVILADGSVRTSIIEETPPTRSLAYVPTPARTVDKNAPKAKNASQSKGKSTSHKVKKGDTLTEIAQKHKVGVAAIRKANKLKGSTIRPGQVLKIPK
jgi:membrane-bound lytic murein transglycosylase D